VEDILLLIKFFSNLRPLRLGEEIKKKKKEEEKRRNRMKT